MTSQWKKLIKGVVGSAGAFAFFWAVYIHFNENRHLPQLDVQCEAVAVDLGLRVSMIRVSAILENVGRQPVEIQAAQCVAGILLPVRKELSDLFDDKSTRIDGDPEKNSAAIEVAALNADTNYISHLAIKSIDDTLKSHQFPVELRLGPGESQNKVFTIYMREPWDTAEVAVVFSDASLEEIRSARERERLNSSCNDNIVFWGSSILVERIK